MNTILENANETVASAVAEVANPSTTETNTTNNDRVTKKLAQLTDQWMKATGKTIDAILAQAKVLHLASTSELITDEVYKRWLKENVKIAKITADRYVAIHEAAELIVKFKEHLSSEFTKLYALARIVKDGKKLTAEQREAIFLEVIDFINTPVTDEKGDHDFKTADEVSKYVSLRLAEVTGKPAKTPATPAATPQTTENGTANENASSGNGSANAAPATSTEQQGQSEETSSFEERVHQAAAEVDEALQQEESDYDDVVIEEMDARFKASYTELQIQKQVRQALASLGMKDFQVSLRITEKKVA